MLAPGSIRFLRDMARICVWSFRPYEGFTRHIRLSSVFNECFLRTWPQDNKMRDGFVNLHVHSHYSILDGKSKPHELAQRAAELNQSAIGITDHGSLGGAFKFYKECVSRGVKPIIGMEAYVAPNSRNNFETVLWGTPEQRRDDVSGSGKYTHLTLVARNVEGLRNLYQLHHLSYSEGFYGKPRIDLELLDRYSKGIVATTGCPSGAIQTRIRLGQLTEAISVAQHLKDIFGDSLYVELMNHGLEIEYLVSPGLLEISERLHIPLLVTADSHYTYEHEASDHDTLLCIQTKAQKSDSNRLRFDGHGYHLSNQREMEIAFGEDYREGIRNTLRVADQVEDYSEMFAASIRMPTLTDDDDWELGIKSAEGLYGKPPEYFKRLKYELDVITSLGFSGYFLTLASIIEEGKKKYGKYTFGPGRGSAAGSIVGYSLGITDVDPILHGLIFERFLNPERLSLPDIDIDIDDSKRDSVIQDVRERFGDEKVANVATYGTIGAKNALKDSAKALGFPYGVGVSLVSRLPSPRAGRQPTLSDLPTQTGFQEIVDAAKGIEGVVRSKGVHASAIIISPDNLSDIIPLWNPRKDGKPRPNTSAFDGDDLSALGLIKFDFLGLATLGVIDETMHLLRDRESSGAFQEVSALPTTFDDSNVHLSRGRELSSLPTTFEDPKVYELLSSGETTGVFQLDGYGMRQLLRRLRPSSLEDVAAVLALYRPGPMGANAHTEYADRKNGKSRVIFPHSEYASALANILSPTFGIIVFQEQLLEVLRVVGGYTYASADLIFNAMRKKDFKKMEAAKPDFEQRLRDNGYSEEAIRALWEVLVPFSDYSFNKSHSISYGIIAYWTAYLKANHPKEYMCSLLSGEEDPDKLHEYIHEAVRLGIPVLSPDINESNYGWTITEKGIRFGFGAIKGVSRKSYGALIKKRPYTNLNHFFSESDSKCLNLGVLRASIQSGVFDSLEPNREGLLNDIEGLVGRALEDRELRKRGETRLWGQNYKVISVRTRDLKGRQELERQVLGIALTTRPLKLRLTRRPTLQELEYIYTIISDNPGDAPIDLVISKLTTLRKIGTMALGPSAQKRFKALGCVKIEETE